MVNEQRDDSLRTLQDIRNMMERSSRFLSLSGWSGVWAGVVGLAGSAVAWSWLSTGTYAAITPGMYTAIVTRFAVLGAIIFILALIGGVFFTWRKSSRQGMSIWNSASRRMTLQMAIPLLAGGIFVIVFVMNQHIQYIVPACLAFYGMALINGSKYTVTDIKYLGYLEMLLACTSMFFPGNGLWFWAIGFGILHILYGIIMWNKYDKTERRAY